MKTFSRRDAKPAKMLAQRILIREDIMKLPLFLILFALFSFQRCNLPTDPFESSTSNKKTIIDDSVEYLKLIGSD